MRADLARLLTLDLPSPQEEDTAMMDAEPKSPCDEAKSSPQRCAANPMITPSPSGRSRRASRRRFWPRAPKSGTPAARPAQPQHGPAFGTVIKDCSVCASTPDGGEIRYRSQRQSGCLLMMATPQGIHEGFAHPDSKPKDHHRHRRLQPGMALSSAAGCVSCAAPTATTSASNSLPDNGSHA